MASGPGRQASSAMGYTCVEVHSSPHSGSSQLPTASQGQRNCLAPARGSLSPQAHLWGGEHPVVEGPYTLATQVGNAV